MARNEILISRGEINKKNRRYAIFLSLSQVCNLGILPWRGYSPLGAKYLSNRYSIILAVTENTLFESLFALISFIET